MVDIPRNKACTLRKACMANLSQCMVNPCTDSQRTDNNNKEADSEVEDLAEVVEWVEWGCLLLWVSVVDCLVESWLGVLSTIMGRINIRTDIKTVESRGYRVLTSGMNNDNGGDMGGDMGGGDF